MSLLDLLPRGRWDVGFFAQAFLGIDLHPGQHRLANAYLLRQPDGWRPAYLNIAASAGNRAGKTLGLAVVICHSAIYKMNQRPPDFASEASIRTWLKEPYDWYHFGIQQEVAELVYVELTRIFDGRHEAQKGRGCPMTEELGPVAKYDKKYRGEYPWIVFDPMLGGAEIHFRTTTEKGIGSLGKTMHGLSMDEAGFEPNLPFIVNEVLQARRVSTGGQLFMISTPSEGFTAFADEWEKGNPDNPTALPRHYSLTISAEENVGYGLDKDMFDAWVASMPPELVPQNVHGQFIQGTKSFFNAAAVKGCFDPELPDSVLAHPQHRYVIGIDPALTHDNTFGVAVDITDRNRMVGVDIKRLRGKQTVPAVVKLGHDLHAAYSKGSVVTGVDASGFGGKQMHEELSGIPGLRKVEFGGSAMTKLRLLMDLKSVIENGRIRFPATGIWLELRRQLLAYRIPDRKIETDAVMALAIAVKLALRTPSGAASASIPFRYYDPDPAGVRGRQESEYWKSMRRRGTFQRIGDLL